MVSFAVVVSFSLVTSIVYSDDPRLVIDTGGHKANIQDVIFTSDGRYLSFTGYDNVV